ncbi:MAG: hypothetical protein KGO96_05735 [Elusimicrobia bacterium]|nr:hypothetical protein [Elusimicrobiota bacterium]MDE2425390.1 hypothetical protein [Elusimicrobiota bacterium]
MRYGPAIILTSALALAPCAASAAAKALLPDGDVVYFHLSRIEYDISGDGPAAVSYKVFLCGFNETGNTLCDDAPLGGSARHEIQPGHKIDFKYGEVLFIPGRRLNADAARLKAKINNPEEVNRVEYYLMFHVTAEYYYGDQHKIVRLIINSDSDNGMPEYNESISLKEIAASRREHRPYLKKLIFDWPDDDIAKTRKYPIVSLLVGTSS